MSDQEHILDALEKLIAISRDGQNGYRDIAERAKDPQIRKFLAGVSLERAKFSGDLEDEAVRLGRADVDRSGSVGGAIHRAWIDLTTDLGGGDDAILSAAESGDERAVKTYQEYINDDKIPENIMGIIRNQAQALTGALDRIRALRQQRKVA